MSLSTKSNSSSYSRQVHQMYLKELRESHEEKLNSTASRSKKCLNCMLCLVFSSRSDIVNAVCQGLYKKYTLKMDYYYKKDINAILNKKRKPFTIKFRDEQFFLNDSEYLKKLYKMKEIRSHLTKISEFCSKFKEYPKFFDPKFFRMMLERVRTHRKQEYFVVFKGRNSIYGGASEPEKKQIDYGNFLGDSVKKIKQTSMKPCVEKKDDAHNASKTSIMEIRKCFNELKVLCSGQADNGLAPETFAFHASVQTRNQLFSESDSRSAINDLEEIIGTISGTKTEFKPLVKSEMDLGGLIRNANIISTLSKAQRVASSGSFVRNKEDVQKNADLEGKRPSTPKVGLFSNPNIAPQEQVGFSVRSRRYNNYIETSQNKIGARGEGDHSLHKVTAAEQSDQTLKNENKQLSTPMGSSSYKNIILPNGSNRKPIGMSRRAGSYSPVTKVTGDKPIKKEGKDDFMAYLDQILEKKQEPAQNSSEKKQKKHPSYSNMIVAVEKSSLTEFNHLLNTVLHKDRIVSSTRNMARSKPPELKVPRTRQHSLGQIRPLSANSPIFMAKNHRHKSHENVVTQTTILSPTLTIEQGLLHENPDQESPQKNFRDSLSRGSKAQKTPKDFIEKIFSYRGNKSQMVSPAALIKSPTKKYDQRSVMTTKNKKEWFGIISAKTDVNELDSHGFKKIQTPAPPAKEELRYKEYYSQIVSPKKPQLQSGGIKAFREKFIVVSDNPQTQEIPFSSKMMPSSAKRKLHPYAEPVGQPIKKRTGSVEEGDTQRLSSKVSNPVNNAQLHSKYQPQENLKRWHDAFNSMRKIQKVIF